MTYEKGKNDHSVTNLIWFEAVFFKKKVVGIKLASFGSKSCHKRFLAGGLKGTDLQSMFKKTIFDNQFFN